MMKTILLTLALALPVAAAGQTHAADAGPVPVPVVTLTAAATASVANDRMHAWLRAEADHADPARAAAEVNAKTARALARAKAISGVEVSTSGYSSYQVAEKGQPSRWRVAQTVSLEGADFTMLATLLTRMQSEDLLVLSGMSFAVSPDARRKAEDALTQQAIRAWQARAQNAAQGFGAQGWRAGRVTIQTGDGGRPQPMMRATAGMAASAPPVSVEGGNTDITVTVIGEAVLDTARAPAR